MNNEFMKKQSQLKVPKGRKEGSFDLGSISPFRLNGRPAEESKPHDPKKEKAVERFIADLNKARSGKKKNG
jgi:hypothetical protein